MRVEAQQLVYDSHADDHMLAAAARTIASREAVCAALIEEIDLWAAVEFGKSRACVLHTETLGQLVDRLAVAWTRSGLRTEDDSPATRPGASLALRQLAELCTGYDDLIADLQCGRCRLPLYQTATNSGPVV